MLDFDLIHRKMARLNMYLEKLGPVMKNSFAAYQENEYLKFSTERLIQLIVECAVDINNHVVVETNNRPPEDYRSSFSKAAEAKLITAELAQKIQGSAGLRNVLVHEYMDIDDRIVYDSVPLMMENYREYLKQVNKFIKQRKKKES